MDRSFRLFCQCLVDGSAFRALRSYRSVRKLFTICVALLTSNQVRRGVGSLCKWQSSKPRPATIVENCRDAGDEYRGLQNSEAFETSHLGDHQKVAVHVSILCRATSQIPTSFGSCVHLMIIVVAMGAALIPTRRSQPHK